MSEIEAFLIFLVYILPFGGMGNIIIGIIEDEKSKIIFGTACLIAALFIMTFLLYRSKKANKLIVKQKKKLLIGIFKQIICGSVLMISEFLILWNFKIQIRYIILIICISLVIMTILSDLIQKS